MNSVAKEENNLIIFLHTGAGHSVDDRIAAWIHVADRQRNCQQRKHHGNAKPQNNVENYGIVGGIRLG